MDGSVQDPIIHTSIDEAFDSTMQFLAMTTRQCRVGACVWWCWLTAYCSSLAD